MSSGHGTRPSGRLRPAAAPWRLAAVAIALALLAAAVPAARHVGLLVPSWVRWQERSIAADLDDDGQAEQVVLRGRRVRVLAADGSELWASDRAWQVSEALVADADADGRDELVMLAWRHGNYGTSRPFWETGPDWRHTQHLYVMGLREGTMRPVWMSHELGEALQVVAVESGEPGEVVLVTREGSRSTWRWEGFGFWLADGK